MTRLTLISTVAVLTFLTIQPDAQAQTQPAPDAPASATQAPQQPTAGQSAAATPAAPASLSVYFDTGSAAVQGDALAVLDHAARLYRDGKPIIMVVSGSADTVGDPSANLRLSQLRAESVLDGLVARGIPVERFQIIAKGETDPAVPTQDGTPEQRNRRAEITWR